MANVQLKPYCCHIAMKCIGGIDVATPCSARAEWEIKNQDDAHDYLHSCTAHVGDLLGDAPVYIVYQIPDEAHDAEAVSEND